MGGGRELRSRSDFLRPLAFSLGKKTRHAMEVGATRGSHLASQGGLCLWVFGEFALQSYKKHLAWLGLACLALAWLCASSTAPLFSSSTCHAGDEPEENPSLNTYRERERESLFISYLPTWVYFITHMFIELLTSSRGQHASHLHCQEGDTTKDSSNELDAAMAHFLFGHMSQVELKLKLSCSCCCCCGQHELHINDACCRWHSAFLQQLPPKCLWLILKTLSHVWHM